MSPIVIFFFIWATSVIVLIPIMLIDLYGTIKAGVTIRELVGTILTGLFLVLMPVLNTGVAFVGVCDLVARAKRKLNQFKFLDKQVGGW